MTPRLVAQSAFGLLLIGFLALLAIVGMTFWLGQRAQVYFDDVIKARDTRAAAVELGSAIQTAESGQRGFLLTGNEIYLAPFDSAKISAQRQLDTLKKSPAPYDQFDPIVRQLSTIVPQKFDEMDKTIALKRARRDAEALAIVGTNRGKTLTDTVNVFISGLVRAADDRLTKGVQEQRANAAWLRTFAIVGSLIILAVVGGAVLTFTRYTRELRRARDEVRGLNAGLEERVRARVADLARANDEIQRFAYIVTHDLRAPLVNIIGFTAELESGLRTLQTAITAPDGSTDPADPNTREAWLAAETDMPEAIGFIRSSTRKMDGLINAILKLSREGRRTLRPERLEVSELIRASIAAIQHLVSEAGAEIDLQIDAPPIVSDRLSLEQIFSNLLDNAIKYRSNGRPLRIGVRAGVAPGGQLSIEIADNGRGISEQDRERVFELFRRSGAQDQAGEGIGLAYVRAVVRNLGGQISMTSTLDVGTTFRLTLPRTLSLSEGVVS